MFHIADNLFFGRLADGSVRVLKFKAPPKIWPQADRYYEPATLILDQTIPAPSWGSVVASVSLGGEENGRFYIAQAFHMNPHNHG